MANRQTEKFLTLSGLMISILMLPALALAHEIGEGDSAFVLGADGAAVIPFIYLGAKHMVTGYDHLLFLAGVIFFLYRPLHVVQYVTLFAVGHSLTLLLGVLADIRINAYLVDTLIGFSVVYKALENMGALQSLGRFRPDTRMAVFAFGLCHGFGLASSLQELSLSEDGLIINLISFNIGVEIGQLVALALLLLAFSFWRLYPGFHRQAFAANAVIMSGGFLAMAWQISAWVTST
ncbi:MAG: HupE/UreJ family protein [Pseudomonadota bacterium]